MDSQPQVSVRWLGTEAWCINFARAPIRSVNNAKLNDNCERCIHYYSDSKPCVDDGSVFGGHCGNGRLWD